MHSSFVRTSLFFAVVIFLLLSLPHRHLDPLRARFMQQFSRFLPNRALLNDLQAEKEQLVRNLELENGQLQQRVIDLEQMLAINTSPLLATTVGSTLARVVYRSPAFWDSSCWVRTTALSGPSNHVALKKNSPVVLGNTLIGIIDLETPSQSRVRLITDPQVVSSVRVKRQGALLAKGELAGSLHPSMRTRGARLSGVGFHYDFPDTEGPARDLRTGQPVGQPDAPISALIAIGDTLVTTGMDGLFPAGLDVATVVSIAPLQEGDYFYELEAESLVPSLDHLTFVSVLPPIDAKQAANDEL